MYRKFQENQLTQCATASGRTVRRQLPIDQVKAMSTAWHPQAAWNIRMRRPTRHPVLHKIVQRVPVKIVLDDQTEGLAAPWYVSRADRQHQSAVGAEREAQKHVRVARVLRPAAEQCAS